MLGDGSDGFRGFCGAVAGWADRGWRVEELTALVVELAQSGVGSGHAAPSSAGAVITPLCAPRMTAPGDTGLRHNGGYLSLSLHAVVTVGIWVGAVHDNLES